jgi:D-alanyl-D-alanine carboxypeptidase
MILIDRGLLSRSDTIDRWYPSFPNAATITVGDLLRMRSGIADSADMAFLEEYWDNPLLNLDAEDMIARAAARGPEFDPPNTITRYTNVNFILLERIVEKVSGTDIRSFLATHIYQPLGLRNTSYPTDSAMPGPLRGYGRASDTAPLEDRTVVDPTPAGGAGALISDLEDLRLYARALCRGDLLQPATQAQRLQPTTLENEPDFIGYGEGLARIGRFCGHNGTIFGFSTEVWYLPEADATFVVSVNRLDRDDASKSFNTFALVSRLLFPSLVNW